MTYGGGGPHKGVMPANVSHDLWLACRTKHGICARTFEALHTTITYWGMWQLIELKEVEASWQNAALWNQDPTGGMRSEH